MIFHSNITHYQTHISELKFWKTTNTIAKFDLLIQNKIIIKHY